MRENDIRQNFQQYRAPNFCLLLSCVDKAHVTYFKNAWCCFFFLVQLLQAGPHPKGRAKWMQHPTCKNYLLHWKKIWLLLFCVAFFKILSFSKYFSAMNTAFDCGPATRFF